MDKGAKVAENTGAWWSYMTLQLIPLDPTPNRDPGPVSLYVRTYLDMGHFRTRAAQVSHG